MKLRLNTLRSRKTKCYVQQVLYTSLLTAFCFYFLFVMHYMSKTIHSIERIDPNEVKGGDSLKDLGNNAVNEVTLISKKLVDFRDDEGEEVATIAYAISLTSCSAATYLADGAAVLKHSIKLSSYPHNKQSRYKFKMVAFVHPDATECMGLLEKLGYDVMIKETPIKISEIKGKFLREHVGKSGCCGDKEFLKLYAYTILDYPIVVHLDLDSLILQPLDDLFDSMLLVHDERNVSIGRLPVMHNKPVPENIEAFFTRDYNMINLGKRHVNIQGGFLVVKPNLKYFEEYKSVILEGDFKPGAGWASKYGGYFGAQQIQGVCAFFFDGLHPGTAVELNRCIYNSMSDSPKRTTTKGELKCLDGKETCEDCRDTDISLIKSVHFTLCQKPWVCPVHVVAHAPLCKMFHRKWFEIRKDLDNELKLRQLDIDYDASDAFLGYCAREGQKGFVRFDIDALSRDISF
mmetsp:Transcript_15179/g.18479  ORF Transcript_15179/g.18479 Transcript_15179/m.18479 type:complete len:460 (-) Transcript_15179:60-1439(-)